MSSFGYTRGRLCPRAFAKPPVAYACHLLPSDVLVPSVCTQSFKQGGGLPAGFDGLVIFLPISIHHVFCKIKKSQPIPIINLIGKSLTL